MPLSDEQRQRIRQMAEERGVDPERALALAEERSGGGSAQGSDGGGERADGRPTAEKFLVGFLPFVRVREFREHWLGLTERVPDDEMMTGEWQKIHGSIGGADDMGEE